MNYSSFDLFKWGEKFWKDPPSGEGALLEAKEQGAREFDEVGGDLEELLRRKQSRIAGRMTLESILSRTKPMVNKWVEGEQQGEGLITGGEGGYYRRIPEGPANSV